MAIQVGPGGVGFGGGGGAGGVGILLRQTTETDKGIFIYHRKGDLSWHAQGEAVGDAEAEVRARIVIPGKGTGNYLTLTMPGVADFPRLPPEAVNQEQILWTDTDGRPVATLNFTGGLGVSRISRIRIKHPVSGARFRGARQKLNVYRRLTADHGRQAEVILQGYVPDDDGVNRLTNVLKVRLTARGIFGNLAHVNITNRSSNSINVSGLNGGALNISQDTDNLLTIQSRINQIASLSRTSNGITYRFSATALISAQSLCNLAEGSFRLTGGNSGAGSVKSINYKLADASSSMDDGSVDRGVLDPTISVGSRVAHDASGVSQSNRAIKLVYNAGTTANSARLSTGSQTAYLRTIWVNGEVTVDDIVALINSQAIINTVKMDASPGDFVSGTESFTIASAADNITINLSAGASDNSVSSYAEYRGQDLNLYIDDTDNMTAIRAMITALDEFTSADITIADDAVGTDTVEGLSSARRSFDDPAFVRRFSGGATVPDIGFNNVSIILINYNDGFTTLGAFKEVLDNHVYGDAYTGGSHVVVDPADVVITGNDKALIDGDNLPGAPTGGRNAVPAGTVEVIARPEDETDGPNILVKYDEDRDLAYNLVNFLANNNGGFTFVVTYGTDITALPEAPPWVKSFYDRPADEVVNPTSGLNKAQVESLVRLLTKGYALKSGGEVAESDIPDSITRDDEIKSWAKVGGGNVPEGQIDSRIARDDEVDAIRHALSLKDVKNILGVDDGQIQIELNDGTTFTTGRDTKFLRYQQAYSNTRNYGESDIVYNTIPQLGVGWYIANRTNFRGIEPGVTNNWRNWWDFLCWGNGAPSSITAIDFDTQNNEIVSTNRRGQVNRKHIPTAGTAVSANPGKGDNDLTSIRIGTNDYNIPRGLNPKLIGSATWINPSNTNFALNSSGTAVTKPDVIPDGEWWGITVSRVSSHMFIFPADAIPSTVQEAGSGIGNINSRGASIGVREGRYFTINFNAAGNLVVAVSNTNIDLGVISLYRLGTGEEGPLDITPSISNYSLTTGDLTPVAGSIAGNRYGLEWQISQSDHVGAARILGFKGAYGDGSSAVVIHNISSGGSAPGHPNVGWSNGQVQLSIPQGVSLAADETYTLRLQVFGEDFTSPGLTTVPVAYQDITIVAHAATSASYHWGRVPYNANDADEDATIARINWSTHDIQTYNSLPDTLTVDLPDDDNYYQMYFYMKASAEQATGFTLNNLPATNSFFPVESRTINTESWNVFLQRPGNRLTHDSNNSDTYGVVS